MEKKIRIQLYDDEGRLINDRMLTQDTEFASGPKDKHEGPFRIEFSLLNQDDIEKAKIYLDMLKGLLPLPEARGRKPSSEEMSTDDSRDQLLKEAIEKSADQDKLITYLREHDFVFLTTDFLETFDFDIKLKTKHRDEYQWMMRCMKRAKNPKSDKYDPMLIMGIKLIGDRTEKVVVYMNREYLEVHKIPLPNKPKETFKKSGMVKFPHYMTEKEREKFRFEIRQYQADPERILSKFFSRWVEYVENVPELENPKK